MLKIKEVKLKQLYNKTFSKKKYIEANIDGSWWQIEYRRFYFFPSDKFTIRLLLFKLRNYHYDLWHCYDRVPVNHQCSRCGIENDTISIPFVRKKLKKILYSKGSYWNKVFAKKEVEEVSNE